MVGAILHASVSGLAALGADELEPTRLAHRIATMTTFVDTSRMVGLNLYLTFNDAVLGRLLMAAAQPEQARNRLDTGLRLAKDTGMCFYDAEFAAAARPHSHRP